MDLSFFCLPVRYLDCFAEEHNKSITWHCIDLEQCSADRVPDISLMSSPRCRNLVSILLKMLKIMPKMRKRPGLRTPNLSSRLCQTLCPNLPSLCPIRKKRIDNKENTEEEPGDKSSSPRFPTRWKPRSSSPNKIRRKWQRRILMMSIKQKYFSSAYNI